MTTGTVHTLAPDLFLIEGHHPHNLWDDPDLPTVAIYRSGGRLYLLDTGAGPEQRDAILEVARRCAAERSIEEVVLLNSHGHLDHLGNNNVIADIPAAARSHYFPRDARHCLDFEAFFGGMYRRGLPYFDYLSGLSFTGEGVASLLRVLGADHTLKADDVADLGARIAGLGIAPALSGFIPSMVVDILLQTYPPVFRSVETMSDYEDLGPAEAIEIGDTQWTGWTFRSADGEPEVYALQSGGHSVAGLVFYLPAHGFLMMADETTSVPIWSDSDPRRTEDTARKALSMIDSGDLRQLCAGHRPMLPTAGDEATAALHQIIGSGRQFAGAVTDALTRHPEGLTIDALFDLLTGEAAEGSMVALLQRLQFPVFSTFLKLTLLNHCLLYGYEQIPGARPAFRLPA